MRPMLLVAGLLLGRATVAVAQQPTTATPSFTAGLSLADAIASAREKNPAFREVQNNRGPAAWGVRNAYSRDRKSTRLNSSHRTISYAVFCLKKKKREHLLGLAQWHSRVVPALDD